jgi:NAD(P)-dependent dehydrogenase (short-subunit alcohol dehydrogenase family)
MGKLEGKIALITGGNSGIGLATAKQFVNEGAYVFITGRREPELAAAVKEIGRNATGVQGDVSNLADLDRLFAQIKREKGRLDIVFANAGVATYARSARSLRSTMTPSSISMSKVCFSRCRRRFRCCRMAPLSS